MMSWGLFKTYLPMKDHRQAYQFLDPIVTNLLVILLFQCVFDFSLPIPDHPLPATRYPMVPPDMIGREFNARYRSSSAVGELRVRTVLMRVERCL